MQFVNELSSHGRTGGLGSNSGVQRAKKKIYKRGSKETDMFEISEEEVIPGRENSRGHKIEDN